MDESPSSGNGVGDLHVNISDLHGKFGDDFGCDDWQYKFGDVVDDSGHDCHDGVSVLNADVKMEQITTENEGNPIDLTHEIAQTNTSDLNSITSTNTRNVDTDVEIVSDLADLEEGIEIPESYRCEKRPRKLKYMKKSINYMKFAQMDSVLVDEIPWDVNRDQKYRIECEREDYIDKAKDGRCLRCIQVAEKAWLERGKWEPVKDHSCAKIRIVLNFYQRASQIWMNLQRTVVLMFANAVATMFIVHIVVLSK